MVKDTPRSINLRNDFVYHPDGYLTRIFGRKKGRAGTKQPNGYIIVGYNKRPYLLHRLIYSYHHDEWPENIDHIDRDKTNNRIENLRPANKSLNEANTGLRRNNSSGHKGVAFHRAANKWRAYLQCKHIGLFDTKEEAARAYNKKAYEMYGEYAFLNEV